jgi:hypothetical protein
MRNKGTYRFRWSNAQNQVSDGKEENETIKLFNCTFQYD